MGVMPDCKPDCGRICGHRAPMACRRVEPVETHPSFQPFVLGQHHVPDYYRAAFDTEHIRAGADVIEMWEAWGIDRPCIASAIKYLIRAGRKPGEAAAKDLSKACEVIQRELGAMASRPDGRGYEP